MTTSSTQIALVATSPTTNASTAPPPSSWVLGSTPSVSQRSNSLVVLSNRERRTLLDKMLLLLASLAITQPFYFVADAYHRFVHAGIVAQGILQYLSSTFPTLVWGSFGSWLRTIRPGIPSPPSSPTLRKSGRLNDSARSWAAACGSTSFSAKPRIKRRSARCSSVGL